MSLLRTLPRTVARRFASRWLGRIIIGTSVGFVRTQVFDRSMTVAAQAFTSIIPLLIMLAALLGQHRAAEIAEQAGLSEGAQRLVVSALNQAGWASFGLIGGLMVLISATSLARALARAYAAVWEPERLPGGLAESWRWLFVVLLLAGYAVGVRMLAHLVDGPLIQNGITLVTDSVVATVVPWVLLCRTVGLRLLVPGGVVFGLVMLALRPAGAIYLPRALAVSERRYGPIGLAFTYIGWLYVLSFCLLAAVIVGQVLARDQGRLGQAIRGAG